MYPLDVAFGTVLGGDDSEDDRDCSTLEAIRMSICIPRCLLDDTLRACIVADKIFNASVYLPERISLEASALNRIALLI